MIIKQGISILNNIIIGKAYLIDRNKIFVRGSKIEDVEKEKERLKKAIKKTVAVYERYKTLFEDRKSSAEIYEAYQLILEDELFTGEALKLIEKDKINAEYALKRVRDHLINTMLASKSDYIKDRIYDLEHLYQRVQGELTSKNYQSIDKATTGDIIISHDLIATDIDIMISKKIHAFATDIGGKTSHNSIIAKSAGILGIVGLKNIYEIVNHGDLIIIDGLLSTIIINPDKTTLEKYTQRKLALKTYLNSVQELNNTITKNGVEITLSANIDSNSDIDAVNKNNLSGVGLYRTEFLFLRDQSITQDDQYNIYKSASEKLENKQLILRTYDLGGDKLTHNQHQYEKDSVFGLRAIRYCMQNKDFFKDQITAILRASYNNNIKIMLPMISSVDELIDVKKFIEEVKDELKAKSIKYNDKIEIGIMIELPAVAVSINKFINYSDFFSIGTNDLIQYTLGVDRTNSLVADYYNPLHPAILQMLSDIFLATASANKEVSVCGEIAGDYRYLPLLLGIGYRSFSMNPQSSQAIQKLITELDTTKCRELFDTVLKCETIAETTKILELFLDENFKNLFSESL